MINTTKLRELAKMTPEQNTDYERLKQAAASVWFAGNMYIGPSMRELMRFFGEYKRLSPEYEQPATAPAGYKVVPDALRKLCKSATPGPWYVSAPAEHAVWKDIGDRRYLIADTSDGFTDDNNSEYIAAANPATVLALLDELDRLSKVESATLQGEKIGCRCTYSDNQTVDTECLYHRAIRSERDRLRAELTAMREDLNDARSEFRKVAAGLNDAAQCIANQAHTIDRLMQIEKAARNLAKVKGRHNSEIAMNQLLDALK